jgi:hypothetical protein
LYIIIYVFYKRETKGFQNQRITTFRYFTTCAIKPGVDKNVSTIKYQDCNTSSSKYVVLYFTP